MRKGDRIICRKCNGKGYVMDWEMTIFTIGLAALTGDHKKQCNRCDGIGYIIIK